MTCILRIHSWPDRQGMFKGMVKKKKTMLLWVSGKIPTKCSSSQMEPFMR